MSSNQAVVRLSRETMHILDKRNRQLNAGLNQIVQRYWAIYEARRDELVARLGGAGSPSGAGALVWLEDAWVSIGGARNEDVSMTLQRLRDAVPNDVQTAVWDLPPEDRVLLIELLEERVYDQMEDTL